MIMEEYQKTFEERLQEEKEKGDHMQKYDFSVPHLTNLNEDQMLCFKIYHNFEGKDKLEIGKGGENFQPDILIRGIGMQEHHAIITKEEDKYYL